MVAGPTSPLRKENAGANGCLVGLRSDLTKLKEAYITNFYRKENMGMVFHSWPAAVAGSGGAAAADGGGPDRRIMGAATTAVTSGAEPSWRGGRARSGEPMCVVRYRGSRDLRELEAR